MDVPVWLELWEHLCCGPRRRVGDQITLSLFVSHDASLEACAHDPAVEVFDPGRVRVWGTGGAGVVRSGPLAFCVERGAVPEGPVRCEGRLCHTEHPVGACYPTTQGQIRAIRWHPSKIVEVAPGVRETWCDTQHGPCIESTDERPQAAQGMFCFWSGSKVRDGSLPSSCHRHGMRNVRQATFWKETCRLCHTPFCLRNP